MLKTANEVDQVADEMLLSRTNTMTKLKIKCWQWHSKSRLKNGNEPFTFNEYSHVLGKQTYLDYIEIGLIDCNDIGGKDKAIEAVNHWFG